MRRPMPLLALSIAIYPDQAARMVLGPASDPRHVPCV